VLLRDLGEGGLIERIRARFTVGAVSDRPFVLGIGDDAAVFDIPSGFSAVFCSDLLAEDTHFIRSLHPPDSVGYKAVAVNVSDVGAMGGVPMHLVISLAAPGDLELAWVDGFYNGVERACLDFGVTLVGGDSSSARSIFVDVAMIGQVRVGGAVRRSGARAGDGIYLTGVLGSSARGLALLRSGDRLSPAVQRHLYPQPRHTVGSNVAAQAHAMIDVSDGLSTDLGHVVMESKVSARIYKDKLPGAEGADEGAVLHGGEEYELIIVAPELPSTIEGVALTRIGEIIPSALDHQVFLIDGVQESVLVPQGWQHFGH
jgi:thiamine-monophosphate kinase